MHKIDRFYPGSKTCSSCNRTNKEPKLKDRWFKCECGYEADRDLKATINILTVGASTVGPDGVTRELALAPLFESLESPGFIHGEYVKKQT